jgi:hypothetical protein
VRRPITQELARPVRDDRAFIGVAVVLNDFDGALQQDDHVVAAVPVGEQDLPIGDAMLASIALEGGQLRLAEEGAKIRALGRRFDLRSRRATHDTTA